MAISMNTAGTANLMSDYAISDAAMAQRNFDAAAEMLNEQSSKFEEMLAQIDTKSQEIGDFQQQFDGGKYDVPTLEELEESGIIYIDEDGRVFAKDPEALMNKLISGEISEEDLPTELLTTEFLESISAFETETGEEDFPEETAKTDYSKQPQDLNVMSELAQLLKAMTGEAESVGEAEFDDAAEETIEAVAVGAITVQTVTADEPFVQTQTPQKTEADTAVKAVTTAENTAADVIVDNSGVKLDEKPQTREVTANADAKGFEISEELEQLGEDKISLISEAAANGEISEVEVRTTEAPVKAEETADIPERAETDANDRQPVQEDADAPGQTAEAPVRKAAETVKITVTEELEMLKNAKTKTTEQETVPAATPTVQQDSVIVFRREDGDVSVKASEIVEQAMKALNEAVTQNKEQTEYSLVLNPEELGRITVKMTKAADGAVSVTIAAENERTQRILEQNSDLMQSNLRNNGVELENWQTVRESQQEAYAQDYSGSSKNPYFTQQNQQSDEPDEDERSFADIIAAM